MLEIGEAQYRKLCLEWLQKPNSDVKTVVSAVSEFGRVLDGSEGSTGLRALVKGSSRVPSAHETHQNASKRQSINSIVNNSDLMLNRKKKKKNVRQTEH